MTHNISAPLSAAALPPAWAQHITAHGKPPSSHLFSLDCIQDTQTSLYIRLEFGTALLDELKFSVDGAVAKPQIEAIPRGARIDLPTGQELLIEGLGAALRLRAHPTEMHLADRNVIYAFLTDETPENVAEWLGFHAASQGADAALLVHRVPDNAPAFEQMDVEGIDTIVHVHCPVPLGHPRMGAESSRHYAADAPGKALLDPVMPDPWRAPVHEVSIVEALRQRFLSCARAILFCTPADLVYGADERIFDVAADGTGFLKFTGKRAYPFAGDENSEFGFSDHSCRAFDGKGAEAIWCAAPALLDPEQHWRLFRTGAPIDPASSEFGYWRFMGLRHPGLAASELAPKSSLIADEDLAALLGEHFDPSDAKTPPKPATIDRSAWKNDRILIVTTMKNEGPFLLEWIAYHRAIGVTDFLVYTNDCDDGTDRFFDLLQDKGYVTHCENPYRTTGEKPQHAAYFAAQETPQAQAADWIICMDVDEYINIHVGDGTLHDLFDAVPDANIFSFTWRLFGNADIEEFEDRPIIEQFDQAAHDNARKPHQAWGVKTLFRNAGFYKKFGVHRPKGLKPEYLDHIHWVNGSGVQMPTAMLRSGWRSNARTVGYELATLNHYAVRSAESFLVKRDRGRVNHVDRDQGLAYWFRMNHNAKQDQSIGDKLPAFRKELAALMSDPEIAAQHASCVAAHIGKINGLKQQSKYCDFYAEITGSRLRMLSRHLARFGNETFLQGPDAVPDDFDPKPENFAASA